MIPTLKMTSVFSLVPYIPQVERREYGQKCRGSKISSVRKHGVVRACSEQKTPALRSTSQEITISAANFVLPLFIHEGEDDVPIGLMPGCNILGWRHGLLDEVYKARDVGVKSFLLSPTIPNEFLFSPKIPNEFLLSPKIPNELKIPTTDETLSDNDLIPRTIRLLKDKYHDIVIYTDVALDPYSHFGYDGIVCKDDVIMNDETVRQLCKQAVFQARAGADVVNSSDMLARAIRTSLDEEGFHDVFIMSCASKYVSYGPFREALDLNPHAMDCLLDLFNGSYQMDQANCKALIEIEDTCEGVDILLTESYPHIVCLLRENSCLPIAAYQVSFDYSVIKFGGLHKTVDEEKMMMGSLLSLRRIGADIILTYFARQAATVLAGEK